MSDKKIPIVLDTPDAMRRWSREAKKAGQRVGFVPTMGALHAGHATLIDRARSECDTVVVSIYVNPSQFGPGEDFSKYPRTLDQDRELCATHGADAIFAPLNLYPKHAYTFVEVRELQDTLCGLSRPGHFAGVATVVTKLFNIVEPDRAYFGRKDAQQLLIVQTLVRDLDLPVEVVPCEIVRDSDGLALSSRNRYLSPKERKLALAVPRALDLARQRIAAGERDAILLLGDMANILVEHEGVELDYCALVDAHTLEDVARLKGDILAAVAVKVGATRLIDNAHFSL
jgi:pantoate--beta-alanine ligase